jgi:ribonuclease HI
MEVKASLKTLRGRLVTDKEIWHSLRDKTFLPRTSQFLWRAMHNAHRVGHYWTHIPECQDRATCQYCGEEESLKHILLRRKSPGAEIIWNAAERLWKERELDWPEVSLGSILGCGLVDFKNDMGRPSQSTRRLYKILMSESAYTIWIICNDRVISRSGEPLSEAEIINKWTFNINQRLQQDIMLANRSTTRNRPRLVATLVRETWSGILDDEDKLPENWLKESRVLVGRRALTHNQLRMRGVG